MSISLIKTIENFTSVNDYDYLTIIPQSTTYYENDAWYQFNTYVKTAAPSTYKLLSQNKYYPLVNPDDSLLNTRCEFNPSRILKSQFSTDPKPTLKTAYVNTKQCKDFKVEVIDYYNSGANNGGTTTITGTCTNAVGQFDRYISAGSPFNYNPHVITYNPGQSGKFLTNFYDVTVNDYQWNTLQFITDNPQSSKLAVRYEIDYVGSVTGIQSTQYWITQYYHIGWDDTIAPKVIAPSIFNNLSVEMWIDYSGGVIIGIPKLSVIIDSTDIARVSADTITIAGCYDVAIPIYNYTHNVNSVYLQSGGAHNGKIRIDTDTLWQITPSIFGISEVPIYQDTLGFLIQDWQHQNIEDASIIMTGTGECEFVGINYDGFMGITKVWQPGGAYTNTWVYTSLIWQGTGDPGGRLIANRVTTTITNKTKNVDLHLTQSTNIGKYIQIPASYRNLQTITTDVDPELETWTTIDVYITNYDLGLGHYSNTITLHRGEAGTCSRYGEYQLYFLNELGGWDTMIFNKKNYVEGTIERLDYKKRLRPNYSISDRGQTNINTTVDEEWTLNTPILETDADVAKFIELLKSTDVYIILNDNDLYSVNVLNSSYLVKQVVNGDILQYSITIKFANRLKKY